MTGRTNFTLAFNISPLQLRDATFGLRVLGILGETGLPPARLELEITESAIVGDALLAQRMIDELRAAGVRIALDDFGTGYATMSQLLSFRFDKIKIDRSFVNNLGSDADSEVIVRAIIGLANGLAWPPPRRASRPTFSSPTSRPTAAWKDRAICSARRCRPRKSPRCSASPRSPPRSPKAG